MLGRRSRLLFLTVLVTFASVQARASELNIPPEASEAIHLMYSGKTEQAIAHRAQARSRAAGASARLSDRGRRALVEDLLQVVGAKIQHD